MDWSFRSLMAAASPIVELQGSESKPASRPDRVARFRQPLHRVAATGVGTTHRWAKRLRPVEHGDELFLRLLWREPPRPRVARVDDPTLWAHEGEPLGPGRKGRARDVAHLVQEERHREAKTRCGLVRLRLAFLERHLLVEDGAFLEVRGELPLVSGMGLGDVDEREVGPVAEALEEALDIARPATKGRSRVAPEDEQQQAVANERCELDRLEIVGVPNDDRGEGVSDLQRLGVAVAEQARDHRVAFRAGGEALDVGAVL